jgi:uncharacterized protein (TIGR03067 family)
MRLVTLLLVGTALVGGAFGSRDATKDDAAKLQGIWEIVSVEIEGKAVPMDDLKASRLIVEGKRYSFKLGKIDLEFTFRLNASETPKAIDLIVAEGADKGSVYRGIYTLEKDRYKICRTTNPGRDRPTAFATRPNSGTMMVVWRRAPARG